MVASHGSHVRLSFGMGPDADSCVSPVVPDRSAERVFAAKNSVTGDCCGDAVGFSTLRKAAMQGTPTSRKSGSTRQQSSETATYSVLQVGQRRGYQRKY